MRKVLLLVLLLVVSGCHHAQTDPKVQARALLESFHHTDWKALGSLIAFPNGQNLGSDLDRFAQKFGEGFQQTGGDLARTVYGSMADIKIGEPVINGNKAAVPVSGSFTVMGRTKPFSGTANMIDEGGTWKWDLTEDGSFEAGIAKQLPILLGVQK